MNGLRRPVGGTCPAWGGSEARFGATERGPTDRWEVRAGGMVPRDRGDGRATRNSEAQGEVPERIGAARRSAGAQRIRSVRALRDERGAIVRAVPDFYKRLV